MEAVISLQSRGRGAFALRKNLKAAKHTTCPLKSDLLDECNIYDVGFRFECVLDEKLHHKAEGYLITILVYSLNSDLWTDKLFQILLSKNVGPIKLERK